MELSLVQAFSIGFAVATVLYFLITGLVWIKMTPGMDREESLALVELTNGKYLSEILQEGHMRIKEMTALPNEMADKGPDPTHTDAERARFSREMISLYITAEGNGGKKPHMH